MDIKRITNKEKEFELLYFLTAALKTDQKEQILRPFVNTICAKPNGIYCTDGHRLHWKEENVLPEGKYEVLKRTKNYIDLKKNKDVLYPNVKKVIPAKFEKEISYEPHKGNKTELPCLIGMVTNALYNYNYINDIWLYNYNFKIMIPIKNTMVQFSFEDDTKALIMGLDKEHYKIETKNIGGE